MSRADRDASHAGSLAAERQRAAASGEEHAVPCEGVPEWNAGAPLPHVLGNGHAVYLAYLVDVTDPHWDGTYVTVKDPGSDDVERIALIRFLNVGSVRFGSPNDEVLQGHPLYGHGLEVYGAHLVRNSRWLKEVQGIKSVHWQYNPGAWLGLNHYLFCFHDATFECLARGFEVEVHQSTMADVLLPAVARTLRP